MNRTRQITQAAIIGAMYFALTHLQNFLVPNSTSWLIQFRASEALCVLALFTPAALPGLTIGCLLYNLSFAGALPLDFLVGSFATFLACGSMRLLRKYPLVALSMPAWFNALFVGWELTIFLGDTAEFDDMEYVFNILKCRDGVLDLKNEDKNIIYRMKTAE